MHTWIGPLVAALRANGQPVLTDVVGGVVLGGANMSPEMARACQPGHDAPAGAHGPAPATAGHRQDRL